MRIVVHDYSGHPGQATLSRGLAARGHTVWHQFSSSYVSGRGSVARRQSDPPGLDFEDVPMRGTFRRYSPIRRLVQETAYAFALGKAIREHAPDVVVFSNVPLIAQFVASKYLRTTHVAQVFWQQDIYSEAIGQSACKRFGPAVGGLVGKIARALEKRVALTASAVVCISASFQTELESWGVPSQRQFVIPNWGPVEELSVAPKQNRWARAHDLDQREVVLYSGTLGLKHDPSILLAVADWMSESLPEARMVVISEGRGRQWLMDQKSKRAGGLRQLVLLDFQPYELLAEVLAAADLLVALLEPGASRFSVPSKVLTYLCAGRPILGFLPATNDAALVIQMAGGEIVAPGDVRHGTSVIQRILSDSECRTAMGASARRYAEHHFAIDPIVTSFESVLESASQGLL